MPARNRIVKLCDGCGREIERPPSLFSHKHQFCNNKCYYADKAKKSAGSITADGYRRIHKNGKYILEHRFVMQEKLKRKLLPEEIVHHINGDKLDNRIRNLKIVKHKEHMHKHLFTGWNVKKALLLLRKGYTFGAVSKKIGISEPGLYSYVTHHGYYLPGSRIGPKWNVSMAIKLRNQGFHYEEIARKMHLPRSTITVYLLSHGLYKHITLAQKNCKRAREGD